MKELYQVVRGALSPDTVDLIKNCMLLSKDSEYYQRGVNNDNVTFKGDEQSPISYSRYGAIYNDALMLTLQPLMEEVTGKTLYPTYTYSRIYWEGSTLAKHVDRPSCQYSCTVNIYNDPEPWPIYMEGTPVLLEPGDLIVYQGCVAEHWREPYTGNQQLQIFVHYVDADHPYAEWKYDKRPMLGLGASYKR